MIAAMVLAAGLSRRMGANKLFLPLGRGSVIERVACALAAGGVDDIVIVTGHERDKVQAALAGCPVRFAHNAGYASGEMFSSVQTGLRAMRPACSAALVAPGDLALLEAEVVSQVIQAYTPGSIVIPSYRRRGGHPILLDRAHWPDILSAPPGATLRDIIRAKASVCYVDVDTASVLGDIDTPEQYQAALRQVEREL